MSDNNFFYKKNTWFTFFFVLVALNMNLNALEVNSRKSLTEEDFDNDDDEVCKHYLFICWYLWDNFKHLMTELEITKNILKK